MRFILKFDAYLKVGVSVFFLLLIISPYLSIAQSVQNPVEFIQRFQALQQDMPREYVHLHTDRDWYYSGDYIWFSAYVTAGPVHRASLLSRVLYVDLIEPTGIIADRVLFRISNGRGSGRLNLGNTADPTGMFEIRAWTVWAANFGESYIFSKPVPVLETSITVEQSKRINQATTDSGLGPSPATNHVFESAIREIDLQFMPEGGHLVSGIASRLAFKVIDKDGYGTDASGYIIGSDNSRTPLATTHLGMGVLDFSAAAGVTYKAHVGEQVFDLPVPLPDGYSLSAKGYDAYLEMHVKSSGIASNTPDPVMMAHTRGEVYFAARILMEDGSGFVQIPRTELASGIVHLTLLDHTGLPVAERLIANLNPIDNVEVLLETDRPSYGLRDEVTGQIRVRQQSTDVSSSVSVSVFDDSILERDPFTTGIVSRLWLESELKGHIEQPGYYFSGEDEGGLQLDLLLLTQGWRAYDMMHYATSDYFAVDRLPEQGISMGGIIRSGLTRRPIEDAAVVFSIGDEHENMNITTTDSVGRFVLDQIDIQGKQTITLRSQNHNAWRPGRDNVLINFDSQFAHIPGKYNAVSQRLYPHVAPDTALNVISERIDIAQTITENFINATLVGELDEITVTAERVRTGMFMERDRGRSSQSIDMDRSTFLQNMPMWMALNQMAGVRATQSSLQIETGSMSLGSLSPPLLFVDGIEVSYSEIVQISTSEVKSINVYRRGYELALWGSRGSGGVLEISTRTGLGLASIQGARPGLLASIIQGYQVPVEYYNPRYGVRSTRTPDGSDARVTLYWNPDVRTQRGVQEFRFWTNDYASRYRMVVEGLTDTGVPFVRTVVFGVGQN
jgi:hypothetical protein